MVHRWYIYRMRNSKERHCLQYDETHITTYIKHLYVTNAKHNSFNNNSSSHTFIFS